MNESRGTNRGGNKRKQKHFRGDSWAAKREQLAWVRLYGGSRREEEGWWLRYRLDNPEIYGTDTLNYGRASTEDRRKAADERNAAIRSSGR